MVRFTKTSQKSKSIKGETYNLGISSSIDFLVIKKEEKNLHAVEAGTDHMQFMLIRLK
jgi:hypothetical protein